MRIYGHRNPVYQPYRMQLILYCRSSQDGQINLLFNAPSISTVPKYLTLPPFLMKSCLAATRKRTLKCWNVPNYFGTLSVAELCCPFNDRRTPSSLSVAMPIFWPNASVGSFANLITNEAKVRQGMSRLGVEYIITRSSSKRQSLLHFLASPFVVGLNGVSFVSSTGLNLLKVFDN